ncbi:MAG: NUDIX hydrolase [Dehalococcoidia bacterium]|nr:NUDIX hydrolase [Dehalococcoidia bacterium]
MPQYPDPGRPLYCARCAAPLGEQERGGSIRPVCAECGWVYYAKNAIGAAVLIVAANSVLLVQRRDKPYRGFWMLPAGFVEYGERPEATAVREALEELGLTVALNGIVGAYFGDDDPRNVGVLLVYEATIDKGELQPGDDAVAADFFRRGALPQHIAFQAHRAALRDWQTGLSVRPGQRSST